MYTHMLLLLLSQNLLDLSCAWLHCTAFGPLGEKFLISLFNHNPTKTQLTPTVHLWLEEALGVPSHIDLYLMLFLCVMDLTMDLTAKRFAGLDPGIVHVWILPPTVQ